MASSVVKSLRSLVPVSEEQQKDLWGSIRSAAPSTTAGWCGLGLGLFATYAAYEQVKFMLYKQGKTKALPGAS